MKKFIDWNFMRDKEDPVFEKVIQQVEELSIYEFLGMKQDWNSELVAQFCSTAWFSGSEADSAINFTIEGHKFAIKAGQLVSVFGFCSR